VSSCDKADSVPVNATRTDPENKPQHSVYQQVACTNLARYESFATTKKNYYIRYWIASQSAHRPSSQIG